jgi:hypothetical protein
MQWPRVAAVLTEVIFTFALLPEKRDLRTMADAFYPSFWKRYHARRA